MFAIDWSGWLASTKQNRRRNAQPARPLRETPRSFECLEGRWTPATITAKPGNFYYDNPAAYIGNVRPGAGDDLVIPSNSTLTVRNASAAKTIASSGQLYLTAGSLSVTGASTFSHLAIDGGLLGGAGSFTVTGVMEWKKGTVTGPATGASTLTIATTGRLDILPAVPATATKQFEKRDLVNKGYINHYQTTFTLGTNGRISNDWTGHYVFQSNGDIWSTATAAQNLGQRFDNYGVVSKNYSAASADVSQVQATFSNYNQLLVESGKVQFERAFVQDQLPGGPVPVTYVGVGGVLKNINAAGFDFKKGDIRGRGRIDGVVKSSARIAPGSYNPAAGDYASTLTFAGSFQQRADGVIELDLWGVNPSVQNDRLRFENGSASVLGKVRVVRRNNVNVFVGMQFRIFDLYQASLSNQSFNVEAWSFPAGRSLVKQNVSGGLDLKVI